MSEKLSFEEAMQRLNIITSTLESNEVNLDEAMKLFEEGLQLINECNTTLTTFETKVNELLTQYQDQGE